MKKWMVLFVISSVAIIACSKDKEINAATYLGTWELTESSGNGIIYAKTDYPPGNGNTITLTSDGRFVRTVKQTDTSYTNDYTYHLGKGKACGHDDATDTILYYGDTQPEVISVREGILSLESTSCVEAGGGAGGSSYRKIN